MFRMMMAAVAACSLFLACSGIAGAGEAPVKVKIGVCDWTIDKSGDPAALSFAAGVGLDGVQVSLKSRGDSLALTAPELRRAFLEAAEKTGTAITSFAIGELNDVPLKSDPRAERWLEQGIGVAREMKIRTILVPFFGKGELRKDPAGIDRVVGALKRLAPKAEQAGVILGIESYLSAEEHLSIIERVGSPAVRVYYDVANSQEAGYDILREIRLLGPKIVEFHAKDTKGLYGKGSVDFNGVRAAMAASGYEGWLVIEGTEFPLGLEKSLRWDVDYLRSIF